MNENLFEFLGRYQPIAAEMTVWGNGLLPLRVTAYLTINLPPLEYVSSVRAIVLRDDSVLVIRDSESTFHILPGGRRELDETIEATLRREVLEETGWTIHEPSLLGILHFHHLAQRPADYAYLYPDFVQLIYWARADEFRALERKPGSYELESGFRSMDEVPGLRLPPSQRFYLNAACNANRQG